MSTWAFDLVITFVFLVPFCILFRYIFDKKEVLFIERNNGNTDFALQMCFYTAVSVYAPAIALSKATGLNTRLAVFLIYLVCIFYSSQGGMKAVVIADTFQVSGFFSSKYYLAV